MKKLRKAYIALIMAFLYAPILLLILYSFNDSKSRANWGGFTLRWYKELFSDAAIMSALGTTLSIGLLAAVFSTLLGTVGAIALYQMKRRPAQGAAEHCQPADAQLGGCHRRFADAALRDG